MSSYLPSFFDKLVGSAVDRHAISLLPRMTLEQIKAGVARDLELLLNTRAIRTANDLEQFPDADKSVLTYGLQDISGMSLSSLDDRNRLCRNLEQAIERHEPRLRHPKASLVTEAGTVSSLCFSISAVLVLPDISDAVNFDAVLQSNTRKYSISHARRTALASSYG